MEVSSDITDPFDWPATMPELRTIDNLLRCGICCEFLNIAMILPKCSHNYCSQCIRRYMNYKSQCPACNTPTIEGEIRNNKVLDEIVKNFVLVRPSILKLCKGQGGQRSAAGSSMSTPTRRRKDDKLTKSAERASSFTPGTALAVKEANKYFTSETPKRPTAEPGTSTTPLNRSNEENISPPRIERLTGDDDDVIIIEDMPPLPKPHAMTSPGTSKDGDSRKLATRSDKSDCPVCGVPVAVKYINSHLDACLRKSTEQPRNPNPVKQRKEKRKALPKLVYNIMSDKELRKKLKEYKLCPQGTRKELIRRLQEYTVLFNAQCDSDDPVPVEDVIKYHERMERIRNKPVQKSSSKAFKLKVEKGQDEETILKSQQEYLKHHSKQFEDLIRVTRERMKAKLPNTDAVTGTNPGSSTTSTSKPPAEGTCSKSDSQEGNSSIERIGGAELEKDKLEKDQPETLPKQCEGEICKRPLKGGEDSTEGGSAANMDQSQVPLPTTEQNENTRGVAVDVLLAGTSSLETSINETDSIQSVESSIAGTESDQCSTVGNIEQTSEEEGSIEEPQSPTLFDNYSLSDEDFQETKDTTLVNGQSSEKLTMEIDDKVMGNRLGEASEVERNVGQVKGHPSPSRGISVGGSSMGPVTSPLDLQTSPVFNGGIYMDKTPVVSPFHNSAPADLPSGVVQTQTNPDIGATSARGRLRRKRKTVLEQLDMDLSNLTEEPTRRASKRNKKSLN